MNNFLSRCSAVIIVKNGAKTLENTLNALSPFAEIVLYDNGSSDDTVMIAKKFTNVRLYQGDFLGFGPTKNYAASLAAYDWIFSLDADEHPDEALLQALAQFDDSDHRRVGEILRTNLFCGKTITTNGWGNDRLIRLYHRRMHHFCNRAVHEQVLISPQSKKIIFPGTLIHQAITGLEQQLQKNQLYARLYAQSTQAKLYPFPWIICKTCFAFIRSYFLRGGFCSGWRGYTIAVSESIGVFYKYALVYADKHTSAKT